MNYLQRLERQGQNSSLEPPEHSPADTLISATENPQGPLNHRTIIKIVVFFQVTESVLI